METTPYAPPVSDLLTEELKKGKPGGWLAGLGLLLYTGPVWGILGTVAGIWGSFQKLSPDRAASPKALSADIGLALTATALGIVVGLAGLVLILLAFLVRKNRESWFFRWTVVLSVFWCLALFPLGLFVGLPVVLLFSWSRTQFRA